MQESYPVSGGRIVVTRSFGDKPIEDVVRSILVRRLEEWDKLTHNGRSAIIIGQNVCSPTQDRQEDIL